MSWDIVISNEKCIERIKRKVAGTEFPIGCYLSGGTCNIENCPKKLGPEDGL